MLAIQDATTNSDLSGVEAALWLAVVGGSGVPGVGLWVPLAPLLGCGAVRGESGWLRSVLLRLRLFGFACPDNSSTTGFTGLGTVGLPITELSRLTELPKLKPGDSIVDAVRKTTGVSS